MIFFLLFPGKTFYMAMGEIDGNKANHYPNYIEKHIQRIKSSPGTSICTYSNAKLRRNVKTIKMP